ncbi:MAG: hypothetical protein ACEQSF_00110 [Solirubrobacteraceae bacterium]
MNIFLSIENKLAGLNTENKEQLHFVDELILKYPYATFLQLIRINALKKLDVSLNQKEISKVYGLFPQRNFLHLLNCVENNEENIIEKETKPLNEQIIAETLTNSLNTNEIIVKNEITNLDFISNKNNLTAKSVEPKTTINEFINEIGTTEIPVVLEALINKYYKENTSGQLNRLKNQEEPEENLFQTIDLNKKMSFKEWANLSNKIQKNALKEIKKPNQNFIIEKFLRENPKISKPNDDFESKEINYDSPEIYSIMTETLAEIYVDQKKYEKAIEGYTILSLKLPEKNLYFADKINQINLKSIHN